MNSSPLSSWPVFTSDDVSAVRDVLLSGLVNRWTGSHCDQFESDFANWSGTRHAISLMNGSVALELALRALGVSCGDEVIVTPRSFIASVSSVVNVGALPVFADIDFNSGNITAESISKVLSARTKAIICVHLGGWPCDMDPIMTLALSNNLFVIEDCAQAHGAFYKGRSVGSIGHIGAWSFCQDKIMSTGGEGGMVTCNDHTLWQSMWAYKEHGKDYSAVYDRTHPSGFRWLHESFGSNYRMTEMQAAIGINQLRKLKDWSLQRSLNAKKIRDTLLPFSINSNVLRVPDIDFHNANLMLDDCEKSSHAYYKYYTYVSPQNLAPGWNRDRIVSEINARGVPCFTGSCPEIYLEKAFENHISRPTESLATAKILGETSLMFLVHPTLTDDEMSFVCLIIV